MFNARSRYIPAANSPLMLQNGLQHPPGYAMDGGSISLECLTVSLPLGRRRLGRNLVPGQTSVIEQCNRFNLASFLFGDSVVIHSLAPKDFSTHNCFSELDAGYAKRKTTNQLSQMRNPSQYREKRLKNIERRIFVQNHTCSRIMRCRVSINGCRMHWRGEAGSLR